MANAVKEKEEVTQGQYYFICGNDDFLVDREGRKLYLEHSTGLSDDFSCEIIDADAQNLAKVESIIKAFITSAQMPSLFGEKKVLWLRGVNFLADTPTGRAEGTKVLVETLLEVLAQLDYEAICVIISASPVDKRTRVFKAFKNTAFFQLIEDSAASSGLEQLVMQECQANGVPINKEATELLLLKVNGNSRLLIQELQKLITFVGKEAQGIDVKLVNEMVAQFGEGDFFEFSEAFFSFDLDWTLDALTRHFFAENEVRVLITSLFNRLRLMIPLRALLDAGSIQASPYGLNKDVLAALAIEHDLVSADPETKSSFNLFSQNAWYLGKLSVVAKKIPLKKLIDIELELIEVFENILEHSQPQEQEAIMRQFVMKCLL